MLIQELGLSAKERKALKPDRESICAEYAWECYKSMGLIVEHDRRGFVAPADFARSSKVDQIAVLKKK